MVGPVAGDGPGSTLRTLRLVTVALVAASAGLVAVRADASLAVVVGATAGGLVAGAVLVWIAFPSPEDLEGGRRSEDWRER